MREELAESGKEVMVGMKGNTKTYVDIRSYATVPCVWLVNYICTCMQKVRIEKQRKEPIVYGIRYGHHFLGQGCPSQCIQYRSTIYVHVYTRLSILGNLQLCI